MRWRRNAFACCGSARAMRRSSWSAIAARSAAVGVYASRAEGREGLDGASGCTSGHHRLLRPSLSAKGRGPYKGARPFIASQEELNSITRPTLFSASTGKPLGLTEVALVALAFAFPSRKAPVDDSASTSHS